MHKLGVTLPRARLVLSILTGSLRLSFALKCRRAAFYEANWLHRRARFDVKDQTVSWYFLVVLNPQNISHLEIFPVLLLESLLSVAEDKLFAPLFVDTISLTFEALVLNEVDQGLSKHIDDPYTDDYVPALVVAT